MLSSSSSLLGSCLNFTVQAGLLGFSTSIVPEGTGEVELFTTDLLVVEDEEDLDLMDHSDDPIPVYKSNEKKEVKKPRRRNWREISDDDEESLQNIVFVTGGNNVKQCLIDQDEYVKQMKQFLDRLGKRVNHSELVDVKEYSKRQLSSSTTETSYAGTDSDASTSEEKNFGFNEEDGELIKYLVGIKIPSKIRGKRFRIKKVWNLENGTLILNEFDSQVYVIGDVGDGINNVETLTRIKLFNDMEEANEKVKSIYHGADFAFFITESDQLYAYGQNLQEQLSIPGCRNTEPSKAQRVNPKLFNNEKPEKVACGSQHSILVTEEGNIYFSGRLHNFESSHFIICRISTVTTKWMVEYFKKSWIGRESDFGFSDGVFIVKKEKIYWLWQLMNSNEILSIFKKTLQSSNIEEFVSFLSAATLFGEVEQEQAVTPSLDKIFMTNLDLFTMEYTLSTNIGENITSEDVIQLIGSIFTMDFSKLAHQSSVETIFLRDFAYLVFTEIVTNPEFAKHIQQVLMLKNFENFTPIRELCLIPQLDFSLRILQMRNNLIMFENTYCYTQKGYNSAQQIVSTFYESFMVTKCNKMYHFPANAHSAHLLTFSLFDPHLQIGPTGCERFRNRNDIELDMKRYALIDNSAHNKYIGHSNVSLKNFEESLTRTGSILIGGVFDCWGECSDFLTDSKKNSLSIIENPLPYPISIEVSSDDLKTFFDSNQNRKYGNIANISRLPEGVIITLMDNSSFMFGSNAYSELGCPSFFSYTTYFDVHETLNKLHPSTIFSEQYSMVLECSKDATKDLDSRYITGISKSNYLRKHLEPFQYTTTGENRTFFFSGDSSGIRSINDVTDVAAESEEETKLIRESEKMVEFNHLSLLKTRYAPDLARYGFDMNISIGLDNMIVYFSKKFEHNNSYNFMNRKLEKLVGCPKFSDCTLQWK